MMYLANDIIQNRGLIRGNLLSDCPVCCKGDVFPTCRVRCLDMAEKMDCSVPSCQVWLDNVCPTKQVVPLIETSSAHTGHHGCYCSNVT
jgi:hypothetical protein